MASEVLKKALMASAAEEYFNIKLVSEADNLEPSAAFTAKMEALVRKTDAPAKRSLRYTLLAAAVIFLISVTMVFSFADVRNEVIRLFREYYYTHFDIEYGFEDSGDIAVGDGINELYTLSGLPDGFTQQSLTENEHSVITVWENDGGDALILSQGDGMTKRSVDAERLTRAVVVSEGTEYEVYSEKGYMVVFWSTRDYTFSIDCYGNFTQDEIISLAENIKEVEE